MVIFSLLRFSRIHEVYEGFLYGGWLVVGVVMIVVGVIDEVEEGL